MLRLNARQSMILVALLLLGFFAISFGFLSRDRQSIPIATVTPGAPDNTSINTAADKPKSNVVTPPTQSNPTSLGLPASTDLSGPAIEIKDFQRSENKDGKLAWELAGSSAKYSLGGTEVVIRDAKVKTRLGSGELATLTTPLATIVMQGAALNEARGTGGVSITLDSGVTLTTKSARFERASGKVASPDQITISHPAGSLTSDSFAGDTLKQVFVFTGNVHTTILPKRNRTEQKE